MGMCAYMIACVHVWGGARSCACVCLSVCPFACVPSRLLTAAQMRRSKGDLQNLVLSFHCVGLRDSIGDKCFLNEATNLIFQAPYMFSSRAVGVFIQSLETKISLFTKDNCLYDKI